MYCAHARVVVRYKGQAARMRTSVVSWLSSLAVLYTNLVLTQASESESAGLVYPLYKQCSPAWGADKMGLANCSVSTCAGATFGRDTVCNEGCAVSCVSMALRTYGYMLDGKAANPGTLNAWLVHNNGYSCIDGNCNNLNLAQVEKIDVYGGIEYVGEIFRPALSQTYILKALNCDMVVIGHVHNRTHFVLLNGSVDAEGNTYTVMDPFFNSTTYSYEDISDAIVYKIERNK